MLEPSERGEMIVLRQGRRSMPLAWTHLLPSTFGGAARMNVANALAATGAAFALDAPLHDIRQGLRTFSTSYYQSPGRLNRIDVSNVEVFVDYCHNPPGMRMLGDFVESYVKQRQGSVEHRISRIGMVGAAGDRRDDDIRELGAIAAQHFDVLVVREDDNLRRRPAGEAARLVREGAEAAQRDGARCRHIETVLDEISAVRHALLLANPGDVTVLCVDQHAKVLAELEERSHLATAGSRSDEDNPGDPDLDVQELRTQAAAAASADETEVRAAIETVSPDSEVPGE